LHGGSFEDRQNVGRDPKEYRDAQKDDGEHADDHQTGIL
jgi:hypothetical protein